jgi:hypothetical protein
MRRKVAIPTWRLKNVTDLSHLSPHVTDHVTDDLEKNLGKTVFVTVSPIKRGVPYPRPTPALPPTHTLTLTLTRYLNLTRPFRITYSVPNVKSRQLTATNADLNHRPLASVLLPDLTLQRF